MSCWPLANIRKAYSLDSWPVEEDFVKLADASGGLFVYAHTVVKYVGDPKFGSSTSQLNDVLYVIDINPMPNIRPGEHPMARLDALYAQILSKVPAKTMEDTRKLLLALVLGWGQGSKSHEKNFVVMRNWLGMTPSRSYGAVNHLFSVLKIPGRDKALKENVQCLHKSFRDYIFDSGRSGLFT